MERRILVPLDGSAGAESIVDVLEGLDLAKGATLVLLHTVLPTAAPALAGPVPMVGPAVVPEDLYEKERAEATAYLGRVRDRLAGRGLKCECEVREGAPVETIAAAQQDLRADLIAMATHARSGIGRLLLGSVADGVVRLARVPVLVSRLEDEAGAGAEADPTQPHA